MRHGESTDDIEDRYGGAHDDRLTARGVEQTKELAKKLKDKGIQIVYSSPRMRAVEAAKIISGSLAVNLNIVENLKERNNYGILTGLVKSEALLKYPNEVKRLEGGFNHPLVTDSESYPDFSKRVIESFWGITGNPEYSTIGIVTHGGPVRCIIREILKLGEVKGIDFCAVMTIDRTGDKISLTGSEGVIFE